MGILLYPFLVVLFWYKDGVLGLISFFGSLDDYLIRLFSLPGLFSTFFKPLKNEYRKNLVFFSILFGMAIKFILIIASLAMLAIVMTIEFLVILVYLAFPILPIIFLFQK